MLNVLQCGPIHEQGICIAINNCKQSRDFFGTNTKTILIQNLITSSVI